MDTQLSEIRLTKEQAEELIAKSVEIFLEAREEWWQEEGEKAGHTWPLCLERVMPWRREILRRLCFRSCVERESTEDKAEIYRHRTI